MDDAQRAATEIALSVLAADGFILAGGQALAEHGVTSRMSDDIDLFAQYRSHTPETFAASVDKITDTLAGAGYLVEVTRQYQEFASLTVTKAETTVVTDLGHRTLDPTEFTKYGLPQAALPQLDQTLTGFAENISQHPRSGSPAEPVDLIGPAPLTGKTQTTRCLALVDDEQVADLTFKYPADGCQGGETDSPSPVIF